LALLSASYYHKRKTFFSLGNYWKSLSASEINTRICGKKKMAEV
jgi:hypothetical protein